MKKYLLLATLFVVFAGCASTPKLNPITDKDSVQAQTSTNDEDDDQKEVLYYGPLTLEETCSPFEKRNAQEMFDLYYMVCADICLKDEGCAPYSQQLCTQKVHELEDETQLKYLSCMMQGQE